jgi:hypothetical protein
MQKTAKQNTNKKMGAWPKWQSACLEFERPSMGSIPITERKRESERVRESAFELKYETL